MKIIYREQYEKEVLKNEILVRDLKDLQQENQSLKEKYNQALSILAEYSPPCELDGFMDKNTDYCELNCGVDEEIFKECWNRYIEQKVGEKNE